MNDTDKLARQAYELAYAGDQDAPQFDALPKHKQYEFLECAEKGGDATTFGNAVTAIVLAERQAEAEAEAESSAEIVEPIEPFEPIEPIEPIIPTEEELFSDKSIVLTESVLSKLNLTKAKLIALARFREIAVTEDNNKSEIVAALIKQ